LTHGIDAKHPLVQRLREVLVPLLSDRSWDRMKTLHAQLGLAWRSDLPSDGGKQGYVARVLADLSKPELLGIGHRMVEQLSERSARDIEDALLWIEAEGVAHVSEVTRIALAKALNARQLHPHEAPDELLGRFARRALGRSFAYAANGVLVEYELDLSYLYGPLPDRPPKARRSSCLELLDAYGFRAWPDARLFQLLEFLVHPTVRQDNEQASLVRELNAVLAVDRVELYPEGQLSGHPVFKARPVTGGVAGRPKNLVFASTGPKPELGFVDAVNNDIAILKHEEHCLVYEEPIGLTGLSWSDLVKWWASREGTDPTDASTRKSLGERLLKSLGSEPERCMFRTYFKLLRPRFGDLLPALVPQVYLHYDPITLRELRLRGEPRRFEVQRMDFLLLLAHGVRVVVEVDGKQHYSTGQDASARPSPAEYARTVQGDRRLRLAGYEVYRFGGYELRDDDACALVVGEFFLKLFRRHKLREAG